MTVYPWLLLFDDFGVVLELVVLGAATTGAGALVVVAGGGAVCVVTGGAAECVVAGADVVVIGAEVVVAGAVWVATGFGLWDGALR
ncbi:MAG: hypothetical protein JO243_15075 [Solirubrobacterales bacterium]|nr:hypothetical protein [Solirubrobacterales bacterium]